VSVFQNEYIDKMCMTPTESKRKIKCQDHCSNDEAYSQLQHN